MTKIIKQILGHFPIAIIKIIFLLAFFLDGCGLKEQKEDGKLLGKWELNEKKFQVNYPILYFNSDSTAIFTSRGDTIYRFKYSLMSENLTLKDLNGVETVWKISKFDGKQLVFEKLFENSKAQRYKKVPNDINNR